MIIRKEKLIDLLVNVAKSCYADCGRNMSSKQELMVKARIEKAINNVRKKK